MCSVEFGPKPQGYTWFLGFKVQILGCELGWSHDMLGRRRGSPRRAKNQVGRLDFRINGLSGIYCIPVLGWLNGREMPKSSATFEVPSHVQDVFSFGQIGSCFLSLLLNPSFCIPLDFFFPIQRAQFFFEQFQFPSLPFPFHSINVDTGSSHSFPGNLGVALHWLSHHLAHKLIHLSV